MDQYYRKVDLKKIPLVALGCNFACNVFLMELNRYYYLNKNVLNIRMNQDNELTAVPKFFEKLFISVRAQNKAELWPSLTKITLAALDI